MDNQRGGGGKSSYASLASGGGPSNYNSTSRDRDSDVGGFRNYDDRSRAPPPRGGGRGGYDSGRGGRGRGRGRFDSDRYGRGGRGGTNSSTILPSRLTPLAANPVHAERFQPSPTAAAAAAAIPRPVLPSSNASASPDQSGYESGEIMPGPSRPVARRRGSGGSSIGEARGTSVSSYDGGGARGSSGRSLDGRAPGGRYGGRSGRGRGGRIVDRGGRGRGYGGRFDSKGPIRDLRDNYTSERAGENPKHFVEPPKEVEITTKDSYARDDDRGAYAAGRISNSKDRSRDPIAGTSRIKYPSGPGSDVERSGSIGKMRDFPPEDRYGKRPRDDDFGYSNDYEDKRLRGNAYDSRVTPVDEPRPYPPSRLSLPDSRSRPSSDFRRLDNDRRSIPREPRDPYDFPPRRDDHPGGQPTIRSERRDRLGLDDGPSRLMDLRERSIDEPRSRSDEAPSRYETSRLRPLDEPRGHLPSYRDDHRSAPPPQPQISALPRDDSRSRMSYRDQPRDVGYRDEGHRPPTSRFDLSKEPLHRDSRSIRPDDVSISRQRGPPDHLGARDGLRDDPREVARELPRPIPRDGYPRDTYRDPHDFHRDARREVSRDLPRDISRERPRGVHRDIPREFSRDSAVPHESLRELSRDLHRETPRSTSRDAPDALPREFVRDPLREFARDIPRDVSARELSRDLPREAARELSRDRPRDISSYDGRGGSVARDSYGRSPIDSYHDRISRAPPSPSAMDVDRGRDFRGNDDYRCGPPQGPSSNKTSWVAPTGSRSPVATSPVPPRRGPPSVDEPPTHRPAYRNEQRGMDGPKVDPVMQRSQSDDKRAPFIDRSGGRGRGRGFGGRGYQSGGPGRSGGRGDHAQLGHSSSHPYRGQEGWSESPRPTLRPSDGDQRVRQDAVPSSGGSWKPSPDAPTAPPSSRQEQDMPTRQGPSLENTAASGNIAKEVIKEESDKSVEKESEPKKVPRPISPPPPGKPSGVVLALARLADLESQMEYAYVKHMQLVKRQQELRLQAKVLEGLPVGIEAFKEELDLMIAVEEAGAEKV